jgi:hypothetical protein
MESRGARQDAGLRLRRASQGLNALDRTGNWEGAMEEPTRDWVGQIFVGRLEHQYRLRQVERLLAVFEGAHGRPVRSVEELTAWVASPEGSAVRLGNASAKNR